MLTQFQQTYIRSQQVRSDFVHFCRDYSKEVEAVNGPIAVLFYTHGNTLNLHRVGKKRVLQVITQPPVA